MTAPMAEARMIEMMARAICRTSCQTWKGTLCERACVAPLENLELGGHSTKARAALSVLARPENITDAMVEAYTRSYYNGDEFLVREIMRNERDVQANKVAIAATLTSAAGDEDRRA